MTDVTSFDGTRLALETAGAEGAPTVVLVDGLGLSIESWGDVPARLAVAHRVLAYDLRGHAQSGDARSADYTLEAHARDLDTVLAACLPDGERAVVVGHSLGGGIVLAAARLAGTGRMAGVVFAGSGGSGVTAPGRRVRGVEALSDALVPRAAFAPGEPAELVARVRDSFLTTRPRAPAGTTMASLRHDGTRLAPHLDVPTLVVHGSADPEVPEDEVRNPLSALPDAELVTLPGAGHVLPLTHGPEVAEQVTRWTARTTHTRTTAPQETR